ncbi:hypothetical protein ABK040_001698 [Willaertia magna]
MKVEVVKAPNKPINSEKEDQGMENVEEKSLFFSWRRDDFDVSDLNQSKIQIEWEFEALHKVQAVSFWFCEETLCPITLYELGKISMLKDTKLFVGVHPNYKRKIDVEVQTKLIRPEVEIVYSIGELSEQVFNQYLIGNKYKKLHEWLIENKTKIMNEDILKIFNSNDLNFENLSNIKETAEPLNNNLFKKTSLMDPLNFNCSATSNFYNSITPIKQTTKKRESKKRKSSKKFFQ